MALVRVCLFIVVVVLSSLLAACDQKHKPSSAKTSSLTDAPSLLDEMKGSVAVQSLMSDGDTLVLISEADFNEALANGYNGTPTSVRTTAAVVDSAANASETLGVFGAPAWNRYVTSKLFVVSRDLHIGSSGYAESRDFYIAAVDMTFAFASVTATGLSFALTSTSLAPAVCETQARGCRAIPYDDTGHVAVHTWAAAEEGYAGLSSDVILNLEAPDAPGNASGRVSQMRLFTNGATAIVNRFECRGEVKINKCDSLAPSKELFKQEQSKQELTSGGGVVVMRESDYAQLLTTGVVGPSEFLQDAVRIATLGNEQECLGISAEVSSGAVNANVIIVARDLALASNGRYEASEWYVSPIHLVGTLPLFGTLPLALLETSFGRYASLGGLCGLTSIPRGTLTCDTPKCLPPGTTQYYNSTFGASRWSVGQSRVGLRIPLAALPSTRTTAYVCSEYQPPAPAVPPLTYAQEECNGIDDNLNGAIDEGGVCERHCVCTTTCSPGQCGTPSNGCGGTITCGGCGALFTCGGGGVPNQCGTSDPCPGQVDCTGGCCMPTLDDCVNC